MNQTFQILGYNLTFSEEKANFVKTKVRYKALSESCRPKITEALKATEDFSDDFYIELGKKCKTGNINAFEQEALKREVNKRKKNPYQPEENFISDFFIKINYDKKASKSYSQGTAYWYQYPPRIFLKCQDTIAKIYANVLYSIAEQLVADAEKNRIYLDVDDTFRLIMKASSLPTNLKVVQQNIKKDYHYVRPNNKASNRLFYASKDVISNFTQEMKAASASGSTIVDYIITPIQNCFFELFDSGFIPWKMPDNAIIENAAENPANSGAYYFFSREDFQSAVAKSLLTDIANCCLFEMTIYQTNQLCSYESISPENSKTAYEKYKLYTKRNLPEEDEKQFMSETLSLDPSDVDYYIAILDKYYDTQGELQRLSRFMGIDISKYIENKLYKLYQDGDTKTLESTLAIKEEILKQQKNYALETSKALNAITERQYFIELMNKAAEMDTEAVIAEWQNVRNGINNFVGEERREFISDENCIDILSRRFRKIHAAAYHNIIHPLNLKDNTNNKGRGYAFYSEDKNYILFEEECQKITHVTLERDDDLTNTALPEDKLCADEVLLACYYYEGIFDNNENGKSLIITNKRMYTKKDGFVNLESVLSCMPISKLLMYSISFECSDGRKAIQLPANKEEFVVVANMFSKLLSAVTGRNMVKEMPASQNNVTNATAVVADTAKSTISSAKKGLTSLFGRIKNTVSATSNQSSATSPSPSLASSESTWQCTCGSVNTSSFCPKCGNKKPE